MNLTSGDIKIDTVERNDITKHFVIPRARTAQGAPAEFSVRTEEGFRSANNPMVDGN